MEVIFVRDIKRYYRFIYLNDYLRLDNLNCVLIIAKNSISIAVPKRIALNTINPLVVYKLASDKVLRI